MDGYADKAVVLGRDVYIARGAQVLGRSTLGDGVSIWNGAVIRADTEEIRIGPRPNVQDNVVIHVDAGHPVAIGSGVTIGHGAIVHGCTVGGNTLIGMGAIILNDACIGRDCIIGAGTLVTQGTVIPDGSMAYGTPAKVIRQLTPTEVEANRANAQAYVDEARALLDDGPSAD